MPQITENSPVKVTGESPVKTTSHQSPLSPPPPFRGERGGGEVVTGGIRDGRILARILAIDPGTTRSAFVLWDGEQILSSGILLNAELKSRLAGFRPASLAIEMIASYGMPVGAEVFETCLWIGRYLESYGSGDLVFRREVKLHLCASPRANDANIRQAIVDRFGGKEKAIGRKATPGPLYGIHGDEWAALGVAITFAETRLEKKSDPTNADMPAAVAS